MGLFRAACSAPVLKGTQTRDKQRVDKVPTHLSGWKWGFLAEGEHQRQDTRRPTQSLKITLLYEILLLLYFFLNVNDYKHLGSK